jgi:hypothetical protein
MLLRVRQDLAPRHVEERTHEALSLQPRDGRHAARPGRAGAAQQVHQHRLGLVVQVVRQEDDLEGGLLQDAVAGRPRRRLEPLARLRDAHAPHG